MRSTLLLCGLLSAGCDSFREELPGLFASAPNDAHGEKRFGQSTPASRDVAALKPGSTSRNRLPQLARQLEVKFKPPAMPVVAKETECSSTISLEIENGDAGRLVLANVDARTQTKNLISRRVSERLESGEQGLLQSLFDTSHDDQSLAGRRDVPTAAVSLTADDLGRIQKQRFLGVFYITEYQGPALILRVGKIRREWFEGHLRAKFVLFDTEPLRMICGTELRVTNDVKSAPIRARLQSETRGRLERELGDALRVAAERSLGRIGEQLQWPDSGTAKPTVIARD